MPRASHAAIMLALISLTSYGCGSSSPSASTKVSSQTDASLPQSAFVSKASRICETLNRNLTNIAETSPSTHKQGAIQRPEIIEVRTRRAKVEDSAIAALERISPPSSMASEWYEIVAGKRDLANALATLANDAEFHDIPAERLTFKSIGEIHEHLSSLAARTGIKPCGELR